MDPDQTAPLGAVLSGFILFAWEQSDQGSYCLLGISLIRVHIVCLGAV